MIIEQELQIGAAEMERLMDAYGDILLRVCYLYLKDLQLAEDALQETFLRAYRGYGHFKRESSEKTWLTSIACNVCKNMLRGSMKKQREELPLEEAVLPGQEEPSGDDTLLRAIMSLSPKHREVVLLYYYQGFCVREIADILDAPVSTISVRMKRARKALRERLGGWYYGE
ncbi:RNA polymerase sigma factor [Candidatus Soleaferrea massiliensis]|uniref:RNA polymerase sigma factor n=1 Tax=Candidatus Soleaferrea massiliensis TaxID=1470354 RepID=UPI0005917FE2|nr:sigma-70 family RNA polymerase sigma factor [Candidatus Soleaferrea massiliensis]